MKNNRGITLVELVIVMIIMILLVTFAVYSGLNSTDKAKATELYEEINHMKNAVSGIMAQKVLEDGDDDWLGDYYNEESGEGWYIVKGIDDLEAGDVDLSDKYELDTIKRTYIVNFGTGDVKLDKPITILGETVTSYDEVRALVESDKI